MTTTETPTVTLDDFTVTLDTQNSRGDKLVLHLDRAGWPQLTLPFGAQQLVWALNDPEYFLGGFRTWIASNIIDCHQNQGWSFEALADALGCTETQARQIHTRAVADAAEAATAQEPATVN